MSSLRVKVGRKDRCSYAVEIGGGMRKLLIRDILEASGWLARKYAVICDLGAARFCGRELVREMKNRKIDCEIFTFTAGERSKTLRTAEELIKKMLKKGFGRGDVVVALGGGVTGDLAGFVASIYMRGIGFIQIPTTLLAMTDAAIGGKTGVDLAEGKNLVGTFYQPAKVYADIDFLKTLPRKEMANGYAEVVKHAIIGDRKLFRMLEKAEKDDLFGSWKVLEAILRRSCRVKARIVSRDEKESHERMKLNLGHTIGHSIEKVMNYRIGHGEAVSIGICRACELSESKGIMRHDAVERVKKVLSRLALPCDLPRGVDPKEVSREISFDKKMINRRLNFVLPVAIGKVVIRTDITANDILKALK